MRDDLVRLEYKLDLIIQALQSCGLMVTDLPSISGIEQDKCPVCETSISLQPEYGSETVQYRCGCELPVKVVPGISGLIISNIEEEKPDGYSRTTDGSEVLQPEKDGGSSS